MDILAARLTGNLDRRPAVLTVFAPAFGPEEVMLADGAYELMRYAAGDGGTFIAGGGGALGLALLAGTAIYSVNRNAQKWRLLGNGKITVSSSGFYLASPTGLHPWNWYGLDAVTVSGAGSAYLQGRADNGSVVSWALRSDWTELLFVLWALARHPRHPQLLDGSWLPPGWTERAGEHGYMTHRQSADIMKALTST